MIPSYPLRMSSLPVSLEHEHERILDHITSLKQKEKDLMDLALVCRVPVVMSDISPSPTMNVGSLAIPHHLPSHQPRGL